MKFLSFHLQRVGIKELTCAVRGVAEESEVLEWLKRVWHFWLSALRERLKYVISGCLNWTCIGLTFFTECAHEEVWNVYSKLMRYYLLECWNKHKAFKCRRWRSSNTWHKTCTKLLNWIHRHMYGISQFTHEVNWNVYGDFEFSRSVNELKRTWKFIGWSYS